MNNDPRSVCVGTTMKNLRFPVVALAIAGLVSYAALSGAETDAGKRLPAKRLAAGAAGSFAASVTPLISEKCVVCHSESLKSGGLNLEQYTTGEAMLKDREEWEKILRRVKAHEMPPAGMPAPDAAEIQKFATFIEGEFKRADAGVAPNPGRVTARRLNRNEYNNTVRDLLGVRFSPADDFPQDDSAYGFDNIADALTLSPTLMEKYMAAAEHVAHIAVFGPELKSSNDRYYPPTPRRMENNPVALTQPTYYSVKDYDVTGLSHPGSYFIRREFPVDGEYLIRLYANGGRPAGSEPGEEGLWIDGKVVKTFEVPDVVTAGGERAQPPVEARVKISAGTHEIAMSFLHQFEGLPASFGGPNPSTKAVPAGGRGNFGGAPGASGAIGGRGASGARAGATGGSGAIGAIGGGGRGARKFEGLYAYQMDIEGPVSYTKGPSPESVKKIFTCSLKGQEHQVPCRREIVGNMARRAFRKPVAPAVLDQLVAIAAGGSQRSGSFDDGIALAIQAMLVSPDFLFRIEANAKPAIVKAGFAAVNNYELASRLSYFLWASLPDDQLLRRAAQGTLRTPVVLEAEVRRMLKDPKSSAFVQNFGGQWLEWRRLETMLPDRDKFPDFEDYLKYSMVHETELFLTNLIREDGPITDLIDGKYSFLNERLARHYGITGVLGPEFRKVDLTGTNRSGVLTQASVLTVSSFVNRTSPVVRGKWVLENVLNSPPPPPPPDVPALDEEKAGVNASVRETLELHRKNPVCASCHSRMDPLGFALENYDAVGAWRTADGKFPIDSSGQLPDGRKLAGVADLKAVLMADRNVFARALTEKMLTYALGRGLDRSDQPVVKKIVEDVGAKQYRVSSLIMGIVSSLPFQNQKLEPAAKTSVVAKRD